MTTTNALPPIPAPPRRTSRWVWLLVIFLLPLGLCVPVCVVTTVATSGKAPVMEGTVLELDLESDLVDGSVSLTQRFTGGQGATLSDVVFALERARTDPKVLGVVARIGGSGHGLATAEELRDAIARFRASHKPTFAFAETFGEMSPGTGGYLLATAFDEVWLQPSGDVNLVPVFGETMFARGALDKAGVDPEFSARKEFKNAPNQYTESNFTAPHREATLALLNGVAAQVADGIAASRPKLGDTVAVRALVAAGPFSSKEALDKGLVDKLGYRDEMLASVEQKLGQKPKLLYPQVYLQRAGRPFDDMGPGIDVIYALGPVTRGRSNDNPLSGSQSFGSDTTAALIRQAANDDTVKAIVLRVDSPGGSYIGSDSIWRAVEQAKAKGKKVVASMGNVAASGGYFVSMGADSIVAENGTITGSIGVFSGKLVTTGLWDKVGVNFETLAADGADTSLYSNDAPYSVDAKKKVDASLDRIYADFVGKAAQGRHKSFDDLEPLAHGRVWLGNEAKERGLVDEIGGLLTAIDVAKRLIGTAPDAPVRVRTLPKSKTPFAEALSVLRNEGGDNSDDTDAASARIGVAPSLLVRARATAAAMEAAALDPPVLLDATLPTVLP